jgi:hypothetical protein
MLSHHTHTLSLSLSRTRPSILGHASSFQCVNDMFARELSSEGLRSLVCIADGGEHRRYVNRYGPGLVIYWFGFIDELNTHKDVLLVDDFPAPEHIVRLRAADLPDLTTAPTLPSLPPTPSRA